MKTIDQALHEKYYSDPDKQLFYITFERPNGDISQVKLTKINLNKLNNSILYQWHGTCLAV